MIAKQSNNPVLASPTETTHVRSDEAQVTSENAKGILWSCVLDQYLHFHPNCCNLVCHLPKLQNLVSPAGIISKTAGSSTQPLHAVLKVPACFIFLRTPFYLVDCRERLHNLSSLRGATSDSSFTHRTLPTLLG